MDITQISWLSSSLSLRKCLIRIAMLWYLVWIRPIPPRFFGRKSVALAMGSFLENCHTCLNMCVSSCCCIGLGIGNTLLRKVTLERISVFKSIAFLLKNMCLREICCICFSIFCTQLLQLIVFVVFRLSVKNKPSILIVFFYLHNFNFLI